jgi:hypothetical protein
MADQNVNITIRALDKTKKGFASVTGGLKRVAGSVLNMKTAIVGAVGAGGFGALIQSSINAGDELAKTADKLGVTTQALAGLRHAAELTGVSTGTMDMALQRFTRRAAEAAKGTGEAKGALRELGIDAESLVRLPLDDQMNIVAEAMSGVETQSDRVRLAMKLFDSEGVALVNTLGGGADALKAMTEEAEHLGLTLSRTDTAQMEAANDAITRLKGVFEGLTNQLGLAFAPIITFVADGLRQMALDASDFGNIGQKVVMAVVRAFGFLRNILHINQIFFTQLKLGVLQLANALGQRLTPVLDFFINRFNDMANSMVGGLLGMEAITTTGEQLVGALPAAISETEAALESLKNSNPGSELVAGIEEFILANRRAAESLAVVREAATGAGGADISAPNFVDRLNESLTKLQESLPTVQQQIDSLAKTTMKNMSDSLMGVVKGTVKLKDAFKQMAASLIMQAIQLFVIDKITGGFVSFAKGLTGKAIGGPVQSGQPYMVGERGPEMFVPNQSGSIIPNKKMGGGVTVINNVDARGSGADVDQKIKFAMAQSSQQTIMTIQDLMRRRRFV